LFVVEIEKIKENRQPNPNGPKLNSGPAQTSLEIQLKSRARPDLPGPAKPDAGPAPSSLSARYRPSPVAARPPFPLQPRGPEPALARPRSACLAHSGPVSSCTNPLRPRAPTLSATPGPHVGAISLLFPSAHRPHPSPPPRSSGWPPFALTPRSAALFLKLDPPGTLIPTPQPPHTLAAAASALRAEQSSLRRRGRKAPLRHSPTGVAQRPRLDARSTPRRPEARERSPSSPTPSSARSAAAGPRRQHCCAGPSPDFELGEHHLSPLVLLRYMASRVTHPRRPGHARRRPRAALHRRGPRPNPNPPPSLPSRVRRRAYLLPGQTRPRIEPVWPRSGVAGAAPPRNACSGQPAPPPAPHSFCATRSKLDDQD